MNRRVKGLIAGLALGSGALPALADAPASAPAEIKLVVVSDDCGGMPLQSVQGEGFSLRFPSFVVKTSESTPLVRKFCALRLKVNAPKNACVLRGGFEVFGSANIAQGAENASVSVRYFAPGESGADYYKTIAPEAGAGDFTGSSEATERGIRRALERDVELSLLIDVTARSAANDPTKTSSVKITEIKVPKLFYRP